MITIQHRERLGGCDARLIELVGATINDLEGMGVKVMVAPDGGLRTLRRQAYLYSLGRTKPGRIVTYADGIHDKSNHQGGHAADLCFRDIYPFHERHPWYLIGEVGKRNGLAWGGDWPGKKCDRPHLQLP